MKPSKRKRVSETFKATIYADDFCMLRMRGGYVGWDHFKPGDCVRVEVTKLERGRHLRLQRNAAAAVDSNAEMGCG